MLLTPEMQGGGFRCRVKADVHLASLELVFDLFHLAPKRYFRCPVLGAFTGDIFLDQTIEGIG